MEIWIKEVIVCDGMFPEMFPLNNTYSSPLKITYLKKLEHEHEKP